MVDYIYYYVEDHMILKKIQLLALSFCLMGAHGVHGKAKVEHALKTNAREELALAVAIQAAKTIKKDGQSDAVVTPASVDTELLALAQHTSETEYPKLKMNYPGEDNIKKLKADLHREFFINRIKQYGIRGVGILAAAYASYRILKGVGVVSSDEALVTQPVPNADPINVRVDKLEQSMPTVLADIKKVKDSVYLPFLSYEWFKQQGSAFVDHFLLIVSAHTVWSKFGSYLNEIFHPGSIKWFAQKTPLVATLAELKQYVIVLDGESATSDHNKAMYEFFIISSINSLVKNLESIIAFVEYKHSKIQDAKAAIEIAEVSRCLFLSTQDFCTKVDALLVDETMDASTRKNKMESYINELQSETTRLIMSFARIEAEKGV